MGWQVLRERDEHNSLKHKLRKIKDLMDDICEEIDDEYSERDDYAERESMGERRGVRGTGRYSRY